MTPQPTTCRHCGRVIHESVDPDVPWVHSDTSNSYCDVAVPEDAVMFAGTPGRTEAEPVDLCQECGEEMFILDNGVSHHASDETPDGIDYEADADHVAIKDGEGLT